MHDIWEQLNDPHYSSPAAHLHSMAAAFECGDPDDCWGPGPPPEFRMPPPPRPPFLQQLSDDKCSEDPLPEIEMCAAMPAMLDPSYHISPSQTSTLIFVCSVLLLFTICLSSFVVWKHKRKVPGFMQCKTPTHPHRAASAGGAALGSGSSRHQSPSLSSPGSRSLAATCGAALYEDPDLHILGRQPAALHRQMLGAQHSSCLHNEALLPKSIHYPSGYPMPHSPPIFVCSSPGPDPYRSHDNVYEELDQQQQQQLQQQQQQSEAATRRNSEADAAPGCDDEDAFAGDELSCAGLDGGYHKAQSQHLYQQPHPVQSISTIYHERRSADNLLDRSASERNSLLSTSTSSSTSAQRGCGLFGGRQQRHQSGASGNQRQHQTMQAQKVRNSRHPQQQQQQAFAAQPPSYDVIQQHAPQQSQQPQHIQQPAQYSRTFDHRASPRFYRHPANNSAHILNAAPYNYQRYVQPMQQQPQFHHLPVGSFAASLQHDVEVKRRNQLNAHLTSSAGIATIYQTTDPQLDCAQHALQSQQQNYYHQQPTRSRTNPRPTDRRRQQPANVYAAQPLAAAYGTYREPAMLAARSATPTTAIRGSQYPSYISPAEFSTFRQATEAAAAATTSAPPQQPASVTTGTASATSQYCLNPITSRDSSFGSDSGYSHHTQSSNHHIVGLLLAAEMAEGGSQQTAAPAAAPTPTAAHITEPET